MLIKSTADLIANCSAANLQMDINAIAPTIVVAERQYIIPYIGQALYTELDTAYNATGGPEITEAQTALVKVIQQALVPYAIYRYAPLIDSSITDGGRRRNETDQSKTAYQYQATMQDRALLLQADQQLDYLLQYLEENKADFPSWTNSDQFKRYRNLFIKTGSQFNENYVTAAPWRNYFSLRGIMEEIELLNVKRLLGPDFFAELKAKELTTDPEYTTEETQLIFLLRKFIANLAIAKGAGAKTLTIDERGITAYVTARATGDDEAKRASATPQQMHALIFDATQSAQEWQNELSFFLQQTASNSVFQTYYNWQQQLAAEKQQEIIDNTINKQPYVGSNTFGLM